MPVVVAALRSAGVRGIVQAGRAGLGSTDPAGHGVDYGSDILAVGAVPHEWLFPRLAAIVHHAGSGTTGATLRAGVPSVPTPVFADQPLWSRRLVELGCAPEVIPFRTISSSRWAAAIRTAVGDPSFRRAAQRMAQRLEAEDGVSAVVEMVGRFEADRIGEPR